MIGINIGDQHLVKKFKLKFNFPYDYIFKIAKCSSAGHYQNLPGECVKEYSAFNQDQQSYGLIWRQFNSSYSAPSSQIDEAFHYTPSDQIDSYPRTGRAYTYLGGGYVFKMQGDAIQTILNNTRILESLDWIDKQTAAVFVEFPLFNPNVNLFQHCQILFETLPTGNIVSSASFSSIDLLDINNGGVLSFRIILNLVFLLFIGVFMADEIRLVAKSGLLAYFRQFYNYIDLAIIAFSWAAFSMYLYRMYSAYAFYKVVRLNAPLKNMEFINLQYATQCDQLLSYFLGICVALATLRFIKLLRFNKRIIVFVNAFKKSLSELSSFGLIFAVLWLSFVQVFYVLLNAQHVEFSSVVSSMETTFRMILGQEAALFFSPDFALFLLPCMYVLFVVCMVFVMINVFLIIMYDSYVIACADQQLDEEDPELFNYLCTLCGSVFVCFNSETSENTSAGVYKDFWDTLPNRFGGLMSRFQKVFILHNFLLQMHLSKPVFKKFLFNFIPFYFFDFYFLFAFGSN